MFEWAPIIAAAAPQGSEGPGLMGFLPFVLIFAVFWFLVIGPARKKQKLHQEMVANLKAGDKVVTNGGIHATVVGVGKSTIQLRISDQVKIDVARHAVAAMHDGEE
jgi:preprotein translocase subunit YajC